MPGISKSPGLSQGALCVYWGMLQHFIRHFTALPESFTSHLYRASKSAQCVCLQLSQVFPGHSYNLEYVHSSTYTCDLLDFQEYVGVLQIPYRHLIFHLFLLCSGFMYYLPHLLSTVSGSYKMKQLILIVFTYTSEENAFHTGLTLIQVK